MLLKVENLAKVKGCNEPRWSGEILFPNRADRTKILLIYFQDCWNVNELYCPHEKELLLTAEISKDGQLRCPRHNHCYSMNTFQDYILTARETGLEQFNIQLSSQSLSVKQNLELLDELHALRKANQLLEDQVVDTLGQMDVMLNEVEDSKKQIEMNFQKQASMTRLFSRLISSIREVMLVINNQGKIQSCNIQAEKTFQLNTTELEGRNPDELLPQEVIKQLHEKVSNNRFNATQSLIYEAIRQDPKIEMEIYLDTKQKTDINEDCNHLLIGSMLYSNSGMEEGCVILISDISMVKQRERDVRKQLVQSEKIVSMGQLVAGVAHELNTPIGVCVTSVSITMEMLDEISENLEQKKLSENQLKNHLDVSRESLSLTEKNLQRTGKLINSFKEIAIDESLSETTSFGLYKLIKELCLSIEAPLIDDVEISINGDTNLTINSQREIWLQVLHGLFLNSLHHAFRGNKQDKKSISLSYTLIEKHLQFIFIDNGCGMNKEQIKKIFDPFYTTSRGKGNIGLGMHIVYNMVDQIFKGTIECQSEIGIGTTFKLSVPII